MPAADAWRCAPHERESCHRVCRASLLRPLCSDGMNRSRSRAKSTRARQSKSSLWHSHLPAPGTFPTPRGSGDRDCSSSAGYLSPWHTVAIEGRRGSKGRLLRSSFCRCFRFLKQTAREQCGLRRALCSIRAHGSTHCLRGVCGLWCEAALPQGQAHTRLVRAARANRTGPVRPGAPLKIG